MLVIDNGENSKIVLKGYEWECYEKKILCILCAWFKCEVII